MFVENPFKKDLLDGKTVDVYWDNNRGVVKFSLKRQKEFNNDFRDEYDVKNYVMNKKYMN